MATKIQLQIIIAHLETQIAELKKESDQILNSALDSESNCCDLKERNAELEVIVKAVAHIGVDFGYGVYEIENKHIEDARQYFLTKGGDA
jgi:hypothetical protein